MEKHLDLTTGSITQKLLQLALPIMGVSFIQTAYSLIDMIWIGKISSDALAAVGTAGFFSWLAEAFVLITKLGVSIKVAHSIGEKNKEKVREYVVGALQMNSVIACIYTLLLLVFHETLIGFFTLGNQEVEKMANIYLVTVGCGMIFFFSGPIFTGIFNGIGDSKTPFIINAIGLVTNIILDPLLIFGCGSVPPLGVLGAALATVIAQATVTFIFIGIIYYRKITYISLNLWQKPAWHLMGEMGRIGIPGAVQSGLFTGFSMVLGRMIAKWGPCAIAAQKVGAQIESISWLTAEGFAVAMATYVGQNYGAGKVDRIHKGVKITLGIASLVGVFATLLLILGREPLMSVFVKEEATIQIGMSYLMILGFSQIFMCLEITIKGAFNGMGRTYLPNAISIIFTGARIPLAIYLAKSYGLNGVWLSVSITSVIKGILLVGIYMYLNKKQRLIRKYKVT